MVMMRGGGEKAEGVINEALEVKTSSGSERVAEEARKAEANIIGTLDQSP